MALNLTIINGEISNINVKKCRKLKDNFIFLYDKSKIDSSVSWKQF